MESMDKEIKSTSQLFNELVSKIKKDIKTNGIRVVEYKRTYLQEHSVAARPEVNLTYEQNLRAYNLVIEQYRESIE